MKKKISFFLSLAVVVIVCVLIFVKCGIYDREAFAYLSSEENYEEYGVKIVKISPITSEKQEFCEVEVEFDKEEDLYKFVEIDESAETVAVTEAPVITAAESDGDENVPVEIESAEESETEEEKPKTAILYIPAKSRAELKKNGFIYAEHETGTERLIGYHVTIKACNYHHDKKDFYYIIGLSYEGNPYLEPQTGIDYLVEIMNKKRALF